MVNRYIRVSSSVWLTANLLSFSEQAEYVSHAFQMDAFTGRKGNFSITYCTKMFRNFCLENSLAPSRSAYLLKRQGSDKPSVRCEKKGALVPWWSIALIHCQPMTRSHADNTNMRWIRINFSKCQDRYTIVMAQPGNWKTWYSFHPLTKLRSVAKLSNYCHIVRLEVHTCKGHLSIEKKGQRR